LAEVHVPRKLDRVGHRVEGNDGNGLRPGREGDGRRDGGDPAVHDGPSEKSYARLTGQPGGESWTKSTKAVARAARFATGCSPPPCSCTAAIARGASARRGPLSP